MNKNTKAVKEKVEQDVGKCLKPTGLFRGGGATGTEQPQQVSSTAGMDLPSLAGCVQDTKGSLIPALAI